MPAEAIKLPTALEGKFRFTKKIYGGPVFDFPQYQLTRVDLSNLSESLAERLVNKGWNGIERVPAKEAPAKEAPAAK
jgi:hypothetical protein